MVEKLKKYNVEMCHCVLGEHMETVQDNDGEFYRVEDVDQLLKQLMANQGNNESR